MQDLTSEKKYRIAQAYFSNVPSKEIGPRFGVSVSQVQIILREVVAKLAAIAGERLHDGINLRWMFNHDGDKWLSLLQKHRAELVED